MGGPLAVSSTLHEPAPSGAVAGKRMPALDGLRGLAILMVMLFHFREQLGLGNPIQRLSRSLLADFGWTGVDLFFVLSGFLITGILLDSKGAVNYFSSFWARRALRIFPVYYFSLIVIFVAFHPHELLWYAVYAQNWLGLSVGSGSHFWSLAVEEQFYLVWPLVVYRLTPRRLVRVATGGIVLACALRFANVIREAYVNPFTRVNALLWGAACACLLRKPAWADRLRSYSRWLWLAPISAFAILRFSPALHSSSTLGAARLRFQHVGYAAIPPSYAALLICAILDDGRSALQRFLSSAPMRMLGRYSYAAYIWHLLVADLIYRAEAHAFRHALPGLLNIPILIAVAFAVSMASYAVIERPFLTLKRRFEPRYSEEITYATVTKKSPRLAR